MDQPTVLRTAKVGGFVKEDVLTYVDELNSKIYSLEEEVKQMQEKASNATDDAAVQRLEKEIKTLRSDLGSANAALRQAQENLAAKDKNGGGEAVAKLTAEAAQLRAEKDKAVAEADELRKASSQRNADADKLRADNASMVAQIQKLTADLAAASSSGNNSEEIAKIQQEVAKRDAQLQETAQKLTAKEQEIEKLKSEVEELKANADDSAISSSFDMGALFAEAQVNVKKMTLEARNSAEKTMREAKEQAQSIVNEANLQAEQKLSDAEKNITSTIAEANAKAQQTIQDANAKAATANEMIGTVRSMLGAEIDGVANRLKEITGLLEKLTVNAHERLEEAQSVIAAARSDVGPVPEKGKPAFEMPNPQAADQLKEKLHTAPAKQPEAVARPAEVKPVSKDISGKPDASLDRNKVPKKPVNFGFDFDDLTKAVEEAAKNGEGEAATSGWNL